MTPGRREVQLSGQETTALYEDNIAELVSQFDTLQSQFDSQLKTQLHHRNSQHNVQQAVYQEKVAALTSQLEARTAECHQVRLPDR